MPRKTIRLKTTTFTIRMSPEEAESLRKCAEVLGLKKATILMNGLRLAQAEVRKHEGQAPDES